MENSEELKIFYIAMIEIDFIVVSVKDSRRSMVILIHNLYVSIIV